MITREAVEEDFDVRTGLDWLASSSGNVADFWERLDCAQQCYHNYTDAPQNRGQNPDFDALGPDVVGAFFAQAKSLLDDRRSYDFSLASHVVPWVGQLGRVCTNLDQIPGSVERAARMLEKLTEPPDSTMFELVMAGNYASAGFGAEFISEEKGVRKTPDLRINEPHFRTPIFLEFKRLRLGDYEIEERRRHKVLFQHAAALIKARTLSVAMDVTYTRELAEIPDSYLADRLAQAVASPIVTLGSYPWSDGFGFGEVRRANLNAVRGDIAKNGPLYFSTKLARLLSNRAIRENGYNMAAVAEPDERDPRVIESITHGSVVTWQCVAPAAIKRKARYLKSKLAEADEQLAEYGLGMAHFALDAELHCQSSDMRRSRNLEELQAFQPRSRLLAFAVHYLVPRISESHSWLIDETVDHFSIDAITKPTLKIFTGSVSVSNDFPAWKQDLPLPSA